MGRPYLRARLESRLKRFKMKRLTKKLLTFFLGALFLALFLELSLPLFGLMHRRLVPSSFGAGTVIACFGNSFTAGVGAPQGESYCDQLQRLLDTSPEHSGKKFRVVNFGKSGTNSSQILLALPRLLAEHKPAIALVMTGEPNFWNYDGYHRFRARQSARDLTLLEKIAARAERLHTVRLVNLWRLKIGEGRAEGRSLYFPDVPLSEERTLGYKWFALLYSWFDRKDWPALTNEEWKEALGALEKLHSLEPEQFTIPALLGRLYRDRFGENERGLEWYARSLEIRPEVFHYDVAADLAGLPLGQKALEVKGAVESMRKVRELLQPGAIANVKGDPKELLSRIRAALPFRPAHGPWRVSAYEALRFVRKTREMFTFIRENIRENPFAAGANPLTQLQRLRELAVKDPELTREAERLVAQLQKQFPSQASYPVDKMANGGVLEWIKSDMQEMARHFEESGTRFLFQTYPPLRNGMPRLENQLIRRVAEEEGWPFTDSEELFARRIAEDQPYYSNVGGPTDNHLNQRGYALIARQLFTKLDSLGWLGSAAGAGTDFQRKLGNQTAIGDSELQRIDAPLGRNAPKERGGYGEAKVVDWVQ